MPKVFKQEIVSLFGQPVAENPTQAMIEPAFAAAGLDWRYLTLEVEPEDLGDAVRGMRAMGFRGGNCTLPHKVAVIEYLDALDPAAELIGAVNCIVRQADQLVGHNTDGKGFVQSLSEVSDPQGKRIAILGAGGAARAIAVELTLAGAEQITIVNRSEKRGEALVQHLNEHLDIEARFIPWKGDFVVPKEVDVLIQATSIGLFPDVEERVALDVASLREGLIVADVIPNPPKTRLLRDAAARGCVTLDGLGMLVNQGVIGLQLWTGETPDPRIMRQALEDVFAES
jgi:shikimate dehydrogenase